ncbi:PH (Pleckstrin Homology) domain-containing protein [Antricoccus suffuscus]|uniref:PH (Pleckstrin Homology) domain-containing protein n=1 Tax=Antricoccus suffuscus TaxID=1629062 RepID=A0A2T0ZC07_9ACTN|nr:PH domain-containing protein [Antricoccus suffuscus]PRZ33892.1 PH (Pleckstrin Homology) domain-containing protein [Antricoccus suffuscus]
MGFPENVLAQNEKVVRSIHPHWLTVFVPCVAAVVIVAVAIFVSWITPPTSGWDTFQWIVVAIAVILLIVFTVVPFLRWRTTHYVITTHRVMVRRGILAKSGKDIALSKITDVSFHQSIWDRIVRAGSLHIESAGDSPDENLKNIPNSNDVQQLVNRLVDEDARRMYAGGQREMLGQQQPSPPMPQSFQDQPPQSQSFRDQQQPFPDQQPPRSSGDGWETQH